jgi:hypothetical protein
MEALVERGAGDSEVRHALLRGQRLAIMRLEQKSVGAGELVEGGGKASRQPLPSFFSLLRETIPVGSDVGLEAGRPALFRSISPDPVDGSMVDACGEEGAESLEIADIWRSLEPAPEDIDDDILGGPLIGDIPSSKGQHLRAIPLVQECNRLRLSLAQGPQEVFVTFREHG